MDWSVKDKGHGHGGGRVNTSVGFSLPGKANDITGMYFPDLVPTYLFPIDIGTIGGEVCEVDFGYRSLSIFYQDLLERGKEGMMRGGKGRTS